MGLVVSEKKIFLVFPIVSLWDLSVAVETTIWIQSAPKPNTINPLTQLRFTLNLIKIGLLASEIFFFEIVDGRTTDGRRRTTDACLSYKLTCEPSAQVSLKYGCTPKIGMHQHLGVNLYLGLHPHICRLKPKYIGVHPQF